MDFGGFLKGLVSKFFGGGQPTPQSTPAPQMQFSGNAFTPGKVISIRPNPNAGQAMAAAPTPQPTAPPQQFGSTLRQQVVSSPPPSNQFKFQMGLNDYSQFAPQVQQALAGTPLQSYADNFVQAGNTHHVDPRVLLTIANNESSLGRNYPTDTYNPFGYDAKSGGMIKGPDGKMYINIPQGLKNAGFTSLPMAIDRLTQRFSDHPVNATGAGYANFRANPTVDNLWAAYNASDAERDNYIKNANAFVQNFR